VAKKNLIRRSHFAASKGVAPASVTGACEKGRALYPATVGNGKFIDAAHPAAVAYNPHGAPAMPDSPAPIEVDSIQTAIRRASAKPAPHIRGHRAKNRKAPPFAARPSRGEDADAEHDADTFQIDIPDDVRVFLDWTLRDLIDKFGTDIRFETWLKATASIETINEKRLKNAATRGELVSRDLVKVGVIDQVNAAHLKLLTDGARTIARRAAAMTGAGRTPDEIEKFVVDQIGSFIKPMKAKIIRALANADA